MEQRAGRDLEEFFIGFQFRFIGGGYFAADELPFLNGQEEAPI